MEVSFTKEHVLMYLEGKRLKLRDTHENRDLIEMLDELIEHIKDMK